MKAACASNFNTSALNRPFDDLGQPRVRSEADAVAALVQEAEAGRIVVVGSEYLEFEIRQDPDLERVARVTSVLRIVGHKVPMSPEVVSRARELEAHGVRALDALHVAAAEAGGAELLVTTDDRMVGAARRASPPFKVVVLNPRDALARLESGT